MIVSKGEILLKRLINIFKSKPDTVKPIDNNIHDALVANLLNRIDFLLSKNLNLYNGVYYNISCKVLESDILKYTLILKTLNSYDCLNTKSDIKNISVSSYVVLPLPTWCSDNGDLLKDHKQILNTWLKEARKLCVKYAELLANPANATASRNATRIRPYITNIDHITEYLVTR